MNKTWCRLPGFIAVIVLIAGLIGCAGGNGGDTSKLTSLPDGIKAPGDKYNPPIKLTSVRDIPSPMVVKYPAGDDLENNVWTRGIKDELGIEIEYLWTADASQYATRLSTMLAAKQFPDFFQLSSGAFKELAEENLLADLTVYYEPYTDEHVKAVHREGGPLALSSATIDGRLMALPWIGMAQEDTQMLWIRTDWLRNLGLEKPRTVEELADVAVAFATRDPDGNGIDDTFGLPVNGDTSGGLMWHKGFLNGYGSYPFAWIDIGGKLEYGSIRPGTRDALLKLQALYAQKKQHD